MIALIQPPKRRAGLFPKDLYAPTGLFSGHAANGGLGYDHRIAEGHRQNNVDQQENTAAVFGRQIGKAPDVPQADGRARRGENKPIFPEKELLLCSL